MPGYNFLVNTHLIRRSELESYDMPTLFFSTSLFFFYLFFLNLFVITIYKHLSHELLAVCDVD